MIISLDDIELYTSCPRLYYFEKKLNLNKEKTFLELNVVKRVIAKANLKALETGYRIDWKPIISYVDREIFKDLDVTEEEVHAEAKRKAEYCLLFLLKWYKEIYLLNGPAFINPTLKWREINDSVPFLYPSKPLEIHLIGNKPYTTIQIYNNIKIRGLGLLAQENLDSIESKIVYLYMGPQGSYKKTEVLLDSKANISTKRHLLNIINMMKAKVDYPSPSSDCESCTYKRRCYL